MVESLRDQLILTIQKTFQYSQEQAEKLFLELMLCVKKRELVSIWGEIVTKHWRYLPCQSIRDIVTKTLNLSPISEHPI